MKGPAGVPMTAVVARRFLLWLSAIPVAVLLGVSLYAGLVRAGLVRNPFAPVAAGELPLAHSDLDIERTLEAATTALRTVT